MIARLFKLSENGTTVRTELGAGLTTFLTMSYIIFVQPAVLSGAMFGFSTGMDFNAILVATCVSAAVATAMMALYARYPIALAPGMGENFFFVLTVLPAASSVAAVQAGVTTAWQVALGVVAVSGIIFLLLSLTPIREMLVDATSASLKNGIAVGIGIFVAFIGLQNAGVIIANEATGVQLNPQFYSPDFIIFFLGLIVTAALHTRRVRGAIIWGIALSTLCTLTAHYALPAFPNIASAPAVAQSKLVTHFVAPDSSLPVWQWFISRPPSVAPTFMKMDIVHALTSAAMIPLIIIFLFMDMFDTIGTLIAVGEQAGLVKGNKLPRAREALLSDAVGTVVGACMGTSTVTSYIESTTGVAEGGKTGLTSLTTAALFLLALFFSPLVRVIGSYPPITAPALVIVGAMMIQNVVKIEWDDFSEAFPAFIAITCIPLTRSIGDGLCLSFILYPCVKLLSGKRREISPLMYALALTLLLYFIFIRTRI